MSSIACSSRLATRYAFSLADVRARVQPLAYEDFSISAEIFPCLRMPPLVQWKCCPFSGPQGTLLLSGHFCSYLNDGPSLPLAILSESVRLPLDCYYTRFCAQRNREAQAVREHRRAVWDLSHTDSHFTSGTHCVILTIVKRHDTKRQRGNGMVPTDWAWMVAIAAFVAGMVTGTLVTLARCKENAYADEGITYSYFNTRKYRTHKAMREGR